MEDFYYSKSRLDIVIRRKKPIQHNTLGAVTSFCTTISYNYAYYYLLPIDDKVVLKIQ